MSIKRVQEKMIYPFRSTYHQTETLHMGGIIVRQHSPALWVEFSADDEKEIRSRLCNGGTGCPCHSVSMRSGTDFYHPKYDRHSYVEFPAGGFAILHDPARWKEYNKDKWEKIVLEKMKGCKGKNNG